MTVRPLYWPTKNTIVVQRSQRMIGDNAYDSDPLDERLQNEYSMEFIAPHKVNRRKPKTQDNRPLWRYRKRWKVELRFAWRTISGESGLVLNIMLKIFSACYKLDVQLCS